MRRLLLCLGVLTLITACAGHPQDDSQVAFGAYWDCAFAAARPHIDNAGLSDREVAMRAQAQCYDHYLQYKMAREQYARSVVDANTHELATTLADQSALQKKRYVTRRVAAWVADVRR